MSNTAGAGPHSGRHGMPRTSNSHCHRDGDDTTANGIECERRFKTRPACGHSVGLLFHDAHFSDRTLPINRRQRIVVRFSSPDFAAPLHWMVLRRLRRVSGISRPANRHRN